MRSATINAWILLGGLICLSGCHGLPKADVDTTESRSVRPPFTRELYAVAGALAKNVNAEVAAANVESSDDCNAQKRTTTAGFPQLVVTPVETSIDHRVAAHRSDGGGTITIDGQSYGIRLVDLDADAGSTGPDRQDVAAESKPTIAAYEQDAAAENPPVPLPADGTVPAAAAAADATLMNLPAALSMVGGDHPAVGFARWKVQEAYANLDQAQVLWLPSLQTGLSFHRHDGNYQASNGGIVDINRSSFQYGFGTGATGAGTTSRPGLRAQFHLADAIFQPDIAQKDAWATGHAEKAVVNRQLRDVALAYLKLLEAHQQLRILQDVRDHTATLSKITDDYAGAGEGLRADADRMQTELSLIDGRINEAREQTDVASAQLAYVLSADHGQKILPMDPTVVPIELVSTNMDKSSLISSGLAHRPELKELQALVAAACDRFERQKYAPFVPSVLLGFSTGGFGGGTGNTINNVDSRYDLDAVVSWEIRNLGFGEQAARRRTKAQVQQAMFRKVSLMDDVAREISEAWTQVTHRRERMAVTQAGIESAQASYDRNLSRIREGEGLPIEVLQSVKALEASRRAYLAAVIAYNEAQFQLQWALGWQVSAPVNG